MILADDPNALGSVGTWTIAGGSVLAALVGREVIGVITNLMKTKHDINSEDAKTIASEYRTIVDLHQKKITELETRETLREGALAAVQQALREEGAKSVKCEARQALYEESLRRYEDAMKQAGIKFFPFDYGKGGQA